MKSVALPNGEISRTFFGRERERKKAFHVQASQANSILNVEKLFVVLNFKAIATIYARIKISCC